MPEVTGSTLADDSPVTAQEVEKRSNDGCHSQMDTNMTDDKNKTGTPDRKLISLEEDYEVQAWSRKFGVTPSELKRAVTAVGNSAVKVEEYLKKGK
jgi:hypothetical protein